MNKVQQFRLMYTINYLMFVISGGGSAIMTALSIMEFRKYGFSYEITKIINGVVQVETVYSIHNFIFTFIMFLFTCGILYNLAGWRKILIFEKKRNDAL